MQRKLNNDGIQNVQRVLFLAILIALSVFLVSVRLIKANSYVDDSQVIAQVEADLLKLEDENMKLSQYIRVRSSLSTISMTASEMGYVKTPNLTYLPTPQNVAFTPDHNFQ